MTQQFSGGSQPTRGTRTIRSLRQAFASLLLLVALTAAPGMAQAQDIDWVLNLNDTGTDPTAAGGTIVYNLSVANNGFDPAPATTVTLTVPGATTLTSATGAITGCSPVPQTGPGTLTCNVPALASLGTAGLTLNVLTTQQGTVSFGASVPTAGDIDAGNNAATEGTTVTTGADVRLNVTGPATAASGSTVPYTLHATNDGPDPVTSMTFQFPVPSGLVNVAPPSGCTLSAGTYSCSVSGPFAVGASVSRVFSGQVSAGSGSDLTAVGSVVDVAPTDPLPANNTNSATTAITGGTDVRITKGRSPSGALLVGDTISFTLGASYTGDSPSGLTITDTVPTNYAITTVTGTPGWTCPAPVGQDVSCTRTSGSGAGANVSLGSVTINATVVSSGSPLNSASIGATGPVDSNLSNNTATDGGATISDPVVDLRANMTGPSPALVVVNNSYTFGISSTNVGNAAFYGTIQMAHSLPAGFTLNGYALNGWTCTPASPPDIAGPATLNCQRVYTSGAPLAAGATTPIVGLNMTATGTGSIVNSMTVSSPDANIAEVNLANNTITYGVTGSAGANAADISVAKSARVATVAAGEIETFDIEIVNAGPQPSTSITLTDDLTQLINGSVGATGAGFIDAVSANGVASGVSCSSANTGGTSRRLTCTIATLPPCSGSDCPVVTVRIRPGGDGGSRTNTASAISSVTADANLSNNNDGAPYSVDARADVTVTKVASPSPAVAGQNLTYVVTAQNVANGLSAAANVTVTDTMPANMTFISATPSSGSCPTAPAANSVTGPGNNQVVCNLGTIANDAQRTLTIVARPNTVTRGTTLTNGVAVTTTTTETDSTNNTATEATPVQNPALDLLVNKIDSIDPIAVGDDTVYTVEVSNLGPSAAENVVVTDLMPTAGLNFQSVSAPSGSCSTVPAVGSVGGTLTCEFPVIPAGQTRNVLITARGVTKGSHVNNVSISSDEIAAGFDTNSANNDATENTTVRTRADVEVVSKVPSADPVNLRDDFDFVVTVRNNTGPGLAEADNVSVTDNLPTNMVLTGTPLVTVTTGSATATTCTGAAGATSFSCDLGTFSSGGVAQITVPVELTAASSLPQTFTNSVSITTSSLDAVPGNNSASGQVTVNSSSIAGNVFRDFAGDAAITVGDTGVTGVTMTLTGTSFDGQPITRTVTTGAGGAYSFPFLPQGTYTVTRGAVSEPHLTNGTTTAGSEGGTAAPTAISAITLSSNTAATDYLFPVVPTARIGIAKAVQAGPTPNADGSFNVTFRLNVRNPSLEPLSSVALADALQGGAPLFGTYAALGTPATDPMARGTYTMLSAPTGSCGGLNGGFNGAGAQTVASGFTLAVGATCQIDLALRIRPTVPLPPVLPGGGRYANQAVVTGEGSLSGQTEATNPQLRDLSDAGTNTDADGDGLSNEAGENDPTPVAPGFAPSIALVKTSGISGFSTPVRTGDTLGYNFAVTNTGNVTLTNVIVTDPLPGIVISGNPIASLAPGGTDTTSITATYELRLADVNAGTVTNQATVTGTDPFDADVTDLSGSAVDNDEPLVTSLTPEPSIALVKTSDSSAFSDPVAVGDTISYSFAVTNTGNVTLNGVTVTDPLPGIVIAGGPIASLDPGVTDSVAFTATYDLIQDDLDAGEVVNQATATGNPVGGGAPVTDLSGADATSDAPTVTSVGQSAAIEIVKTADDSDFEDGEQPGDEVRYTFTVTNSGNVTLNNVTVSDPLPGLVLTGSPITTLAPGASDTTTYTAAYVPTPADSTAGEVENTATVTGDYGPGNSLSVTDDDTATAVVVAIEANPEPFPPFETDGGTTTTVLASDREGGGQATLANVTIRVIETSDPGVTLDPATGLITLAPGNPAGDYAVTYEICSVANPTVCDQTTETVTQLPITEIETTKTQVLVDNGDGIDGVGDRIDYTITVENKSNVPLENIVLDDTLTSLADNPLPLDGLPSFVEASEGSREGTLEIGETATYTASYTLTIDAVTDGGTSNTITATGLPVFGPGVIGTPEPVSDISDDGNDTDGDVSGDPTELRIDTSLAPTGLTVEKTTPRGVVERGSVVPYTITVTNDNPVVSGTLDIVDVLPAGFLYQPGTATLDGVSIEVEVAGRVIAWPDVPVPPLTTVTATLSARILTGAQSGEHVNSATIRNPATNGLLAPPATATVRILPEPVFDCGDVIGKVFDDRNGDGYQNPAGPPPIIDQDAGFVGKGKISSAPIAPKWGEPGIPAARLAGVDGTIITTDEHGRFHVPCAILPADRGSNFILKLDTRSLPSGYRLTTENPRVVRLTPGKMTRMNFGVALTKVVRIDLNSRAFVMGDGGAQLSPPLVQGIATLLPQIADEVVNLRLAYHLPPGADSAAAKEARSHLKLVEAHVRRIWRDIGRVKLVIERTLVRNGG